MNAAPSIHRSGPRLLYDQPPQRKPAKSGMPPPSVHGRGPPQLPQKPPVFWVPHVGHDQVPGVSGF